MKGKITAAGFLALALVAGGGMALEWQAGAALRREIALLQDDNRALGRLRAENARLTAAQPPAEALERWRADRAAVLRLRGEIRTLNARAEQAMGGGAGAAVEAGPTVRKIFSVGAGGVVTAEGGKVDHLALFEQFLGWRAERKSAELRVGWADPRVPFVLEDVKRAMEQIEVLAKEAGLRFTLVFDPPPTP